MSGIGTAGVGVMTITSTKNYYKSDIIDSDDDSKSSVKIEGTRQNKNMDESCRNRYAKRLPGFQKRH